jgi:hypothetical protein
MLIDYMNPRRLKHLQAIAAARGQSLGDWIDDLIATAERQAGPARQGSRQLLGCPLVELASDFLARLCASDSEIRRVAAALRAAAIDGEHSHVGPLNPDGLIVELSPQWEGVRIIVGEGRFTLTDTAALQLADQLQTQCRRRTMAA